MYGGEERFIKSDGIHTSREKKLKHVVRSLLNYCIQ